MITLFQHQQQALDLTEGHNRCAYYLDMGLGKTFVGSEKALTLNSRVNLLICQCSKVSDWIDHMVENYAMNHCWMIYDLTNKKEFDWFTMLPCWTWLKMLAGPSALMGKSYLLKWME